MKSSLTILDDNLSRKANSIGAKLTKDNDKGAWLPDGFEERSLRWRNQEFQYLIQIYPTFNNDEVNSWILWACCFVDKDKNRFWKKKNIIESKNKNELISNFDILFDEAIHFLTNLTFEELEFVTELKS